MFLVILNYDFERARNPHTSVIPECQYRESSTPRVHESDVAVFDHDSILPLSCPPGVALAKRGI